MDQGNLKVTRNPGWSFSGGSLKKHRLLLMAALLIAAPFCRAVDVDWGNLKKETVMNAISSFDSNPGNMDGEIAGSVIISFAEASTNVTVNIDAGFLPWMHREPVVRRGELLLVAFVAGNIRPQLKSGIDQDQPVDGILFMCRVYTALRKENLIAEIPEPELWCKLSRKEVAKLVSSLQSSTMKDKEKPVEKIKMF